MNSAQKYLTNLLLEIDAICKKYDIEYFIDYGTTLGAVRHQGFIPWDDDIDINMTEENYYKWVEACKKELDPEKRYYSDGRLDREFPGVFGRYIDVETMRMSNNFAFWKPICGQSIDVFYLLELPGDPQLKQKAIDLYFVYDEYSNSSYRHYRKKTAEQMRLYEECLELEKKIGKEQVLKQFEEKIFHKHYDDCDTYIVTSARKFGPSSIAPKSYYDSVYMADFEGHKFPIAGKYVELMTHYYGDSWDILPENKKHHSQMSKTDFKCKDYFEDYSRLIDKDSLLKERQEFKNIAVKEGYLVFEHLNNVYKKVGDCVVLKIKRQLAKSGVSINDLLVPDDKEKLNCLDELFSEYYAKQLNPSVRYWEILFDIDDDLLYGAVFNLVYNRNDLNSFNKIMKLINENKVTPPKKVMQLWELVLIARKVKAEVIYKNYDVAEKLLSDGLEKFPCSKELKIFRLILNVLTADGEKELANAEIMANNLLTEYPKNDMCIKALGDIAYFRGNYEEAEKHYSLVMKNSFNGMLHLDIKKKREAIK